MKTISVVAGLLLLVLGAAIGFAYSGIFNVAATARDATAVRWILETTRENSVRRGAEQISLADLSDHMRLPRGAKAFNDMCAGCHGAPGRGSFLGANDMNPPPPDLAKMAAERSPQALFWVIKNGLRMTGMPAWGPTHSDDQLWDLVAFMSQLPELTPERYRALAEAQGGDGHDHDHASAANVDTEVMAAPASVVDATVSERETRHEHNATDGHSH